MEGEAPMGFFAWLREGVRRAVLMGFSDAVEELGKRTEAEDMGPALALTLRQSIVYSGDVGQATKVTAAPAAGRKRLGRSLEQIRETGGKPA